MSLRYYAPGSLQKAGGPREKSKNSGARNERPGMSDEHRKLIKQLPCCVCGARPPGDPHHLKEGPPSAERGAGLKATDQWLVPLCRDHHDEIEKLSSNSEIAWFNRRGINCLWLARSLWKATGDLAKMRLVLVSHTGEEK